MTLSFDDIIIGDNTNYAITSIEGLSLEKLDSVWSPNARALGRLFISNYKRERTITIQGYIFGENYRDYLDKRAKIQGLLYAGPNTSKNFVLTDYGETPKSYKLTGYLEEFTSNPGEGQLLDAGLFTLVIGLEDPILRSNDTFSESIALKKAGNTYNYGYKYDYINRTSKITFVNTGNHPVYPNFKITGGLRNLKITNKNSPLENKTFILGLDNEPFVLVDKDYIEIDPTTFTKITQGDEKIPKYSFAHNIEALKSYPGENTFIFNAGGGITANSLATLTINYGYSSI